jgi:fatty acid desaturase
MNYHVEHHMFPMVPYHALPRLHALIKNDLPPPNASILDGYREMIPAVLKQLRDPDYYLRRELPPTARPYREDLHESALGLKTVA